MKDDWPLVLLLVDLIAILMAWRNIEPRRAVHDAAS